jgi:hypothetical protein
VPLLPFRTSDKTGGRKAYITSSSGRSRVRSAHERKNCEARRDQKPRPAKSGVREVSTRASTQLPGGNGCYCGDQNVVRLSGSSPLPKGPFQANVTRKDDRTTGSERTRQSSSTFSPGAARQTGSPRCKSEGNLRDQRSDP